MGLVLHCMLSTPSLFEVKFLTKSCLVGKLLTCVSVLFAHKLLCCFTLALQTNFSLRMNNRIIFSDLRESDKNNTQRFFFLVLPIFIICRQKIIHCDHVWWETFLYEKVFFFFKALLHWIVLQRSHLVAITFGATLLGKMLAAEVRDMLDDFRMKAGWRSAMYNFTQKRRNTRLYFCSFFPVSLCVLSFSRPVFLYFFVFPSVFMSILYIFVRWALKKKRAVLKGVS